MYEDDDDFQKTIKVRYDDVFTNGSGFLFCADVFFWIWTF